MKTTSLVVTAIATLASTTSLFANATFASQPAKVGSHVAATLQVPLDLDSPAPFLTLAAAGENPHAGHGAHGGHGDHMADANPAGFAPVVAGDLELTAGFTKAMLPGQPVGGGFITITNKGGEDDRLVSATSSQAGEVQLHEMAMEGDVMKMRQLNDGIVIPAGETVELKPGGLHLMFFKVSEPFKEGASVNVTLTFEKAGAVDVVLPIGPARGN